MFPAFSICANPNPSALGFLWANSLTADVEARVGFEPTYGGFADLSLRPLGYRAGGKEYNETAVHLSVANMTSEFA
jgi:hypothetical protein